MHYIIIADVFCSLESGPANHALVYENSDLKFLKVLGFVVLLQAIAQIVYLLYN